MTWLRIASFRGAGSETKSEISDCKPRLDDRDLSLRDQQERLEEFPNRANPFRRNRGAANVGSAVPPPVSGRSTDSFCQETGNRGASSHSQAAPGKQVSQKKISRLSSNSASSPCALGDRNLAGSRSHATPLCVQGLTATHARCVRLTPRGRMIRSKWPKRFVNSIGSMISPPLIGRFGSPLGVRV